MFFLVSKIFSFLLSPVTWIFVLLLWAVLTRRPKRRFRMLVSATILLWVFTNGFLFSEVMRLWEPRPVKLNRHEHFDYAIVLGGMSGFNGEYDRPVFYRSVDRLLQTLPLYKNGTVGKILITGGSGRLIYRDQREALILRDYLMSIGFNEEDIVVEAESRNTRENAVNTALLLEGTGISNPKLLLITSAYHMPRSMAVFRKAGLEVTPFPVDFYSAPVRRFHPDHLLLPNPEILFHWDLLIHEMAGSMIYKLMGYS